MDLGYLPRIPGHGALYHWTDPRGAAPCIWDLVCTHIQAEEKAFELVPSGTINMLNTEAPTQQHPAILQTEQRIVNSPATLNTDESKS